MDNHGMICSVDDCLKIARARGLCGTHYQRWRRLGSVDLPRKPNVNERFELAIDKTDSCWLWKSTKEGQRGRISVDGKFTRAYRLSWVLHYGPIPDGLDVLHNCPGGDNPRCVNPDHLFLGMQRDNSLDASRKGMLVHGEAHGKSILPDSVVLDIQRRKLAGESTAKLAQEYGTSEASVSRYAQGKTRRDVTLQLIERS